MHEGRTSTRNAPGRLTEIRDRRREPERPVTPRQENAGARLACAASTRHRGPSSTTRSQRSRERRGVRWTAPILATQPRWLAAASRRRLTRASTRGRPTWKPITVAIAPATATAPPRTHQRCQIEPTILLRPSTMTRLLGRRRRPRPGGRQATCPRKQSCNTGRRTAMAVPPVPPTEFPREGRRNRLLEEEPDVSATSRS